MDQNETKKNFFFRITLYKYRAIQKFFYQVGHDGGNECRWAAAIWRVLKIKNIFYWSVRTFDFFNLTFFYFMV
jgi:hypothetical protein